MIFFGLTLLLVAAPLAEEQAFIDAVGLFRGGDPVAAEVQLGPLLDDVGERSVQEQAQLWMWAAVFADGAGRVQVARERLERVVALGVAVELPSDASLRLAGMYEEVAAARPGRGVPVAAPAPAEPAPEAQPSAPPVPAEQPSTQEGASPQESKGGEGKGQKGKADDGKPDGSASDDDAKPAASKKAKPAASNEESAAQAGDQLPPEDDGEPFINLGTSFWAGAGAGLTFGLLAGTFGAVFGISSGLHYLDAQNDMLDQDRRDAGQELWPQEIRWAGIFGAVAMGLFVLAGGCAVVALFLDE